MIYNKHKSPSICSHYRFSHRGKMKNKKTSKLNLRVLVQVIVVQTHVVVHPSGPQMKARVGGYGVGTLVEGAGSGAWVGGAVKDSPFPSPWSGPSTPDSSLPPPSPSPLHLHLLPVLPLLFLLFPLLLPSSSPSSSSRTTGGP